LTLAAKKLLVYAALGLLTIWPGVQIWLAKSYGVSPWKLGAWGMYAVPRPKYVGMELLYRERGADRFQLLRQPTDADRAAAGEFLNRYRWLGKLSRPQTFLRSMLEMHPQWEALRVELSQPVLERETGMIVMRKEVFEIPPPPPKSPG
jgi:hypothetical protein